MIARFLSYFIPITIKKFPSKINSTLEVTWNNGKLVLDTINTNYSYGNLQKILNKGLVAIGYSKIRTMNSALVLGLGAGSILQTLRKDVGYKKPITSVEIDPAVVGVAKKFFELDTFQNHELILGDAFDFVLRCTQQYDLIVLDIFQDTQMPSFLFEEHFIAHLKKILSPNGYLLFNTITLIPAHNKRNTTYIKHYEPSDYSVERLSKIQNHNEIILIHKL